MEFLPTWVDYFILMAFASFFLLSGWLTYWVLRPEEVGLKNPIRDNHRVVEQTSHSGKEIETFRNFSMIEPLLLIVINALVVTSFILLLTAQLGLFRIRFWFALLLLYDGLVFVYLRSWRRLQFHSLFRRRGKFERSDLLVLPICLLATSTFYRPSESIHTRDPGGYVNIAVKLSETGSLRFKDPDFQHFDFKERQDLFLLTPLSDFPYPQVLPGFHLVDPASGKLVPRYFPLFPLWLALVFKLWRFQGVFALNVLFGILSVVILIPLAQRLFGSKMVGWLAACLLALNIGQIWIVRSPFSEILAQVFLLAGIWILAKGMTEQRKGPCILAGLVFGLSLFVRIDSILALVALGIFAGVMWFKSGIRTRSFPWGAFFSTLGGVFVYVSLHTCLLAFPYLVNVINAIERRSSPVRPFLLILGFGAIISLVAWRRNTLLASLSSEKSRKKFLTLIFALVTSLFVYGYFIRPYLFPGTEYIPLPFPQKGSIKFYDEISLVRLGWYLSPFGILLAYLGSLIALQRLVKEGKLVLLPFTLILGGFSLFYLYKSRAFPENYWVVRRYVEVVIPGFLLLASLMIVSLFKWVCGPSLKGALAKMRLAIALAISCCCFFLLAFFQLAGAYPLMNQTELKGSYRQLENLTGANRDADILLLEAGQFQDLFSSPLKFIFHKTVYAFATEKPEVLGFEKLMDEWTQQGKRVHLLASEEQTELLSRKYRFVPKDRFLFRTQVVERSYDRLPQSMEDLRFTVQIYKVERKPPQENSNSITVNLGYNFGFMTKGFYTTELSTDYEPFRWSGATSTIEMPRIDGSQDALLILRLRRDLPHNLALTPIKIFLNGSLVAETPASSKFEVRRCEVPGSLLNHEGKNKIRFSSSTYCPARLGSSNDIRDLGFMLHCLKLQSLDPISPRQPYVVDLGAECDLVDAELTGFYGKEPGSFRWTGPSAQVVLPSRLAPEPGMEVSLRAMKSSPDPKMKQFLSLSVNDQEIGKTELSGGWDEFRTYHFLVPQRIPKSQSTVIKMKVTPPWIPKSSDYFTDDWRTLGCAIDWLKIGGVE